MFAVPGKRTAIGKGMPIVQQIESKITVSLPAMATDKALLTLVCFLLAIQLPMDAVPGSSCVVGYGKRIFF
jgi:hypothetical protein